MNTTTLVQHLASRMLFLQLVEKRDWDDEQQFKIDLLLQFEEEEESFRRSLAKGEDHQRQFLKFVQEQEADKIKDIRIIETVVDGRTQYRG